MTGRQGPSFNKIEKIYLKSGRAMRFIQDLWVVLYIPCVNIIQHTPKYLLIRRSVEGKQDIIQLYTGMIFTKWKLSVLMKRIIISLWIPFIFISTRQHHTKWPTQWWCQISPKDIGGVFSFSEYCLVFHVVSTLVWY